MTNGFNLNNLYHTIWNVLWEDASQDICDTGKLYLFEAIQDDIEEQVITMITGNAPCS